MKELLKKLIEFETTAQNGDQLAAIIQFAEDFLRRPALTIHRYERNGKPSLVATFQPGSKRSRVMFVGHLDVVDAEPEQFHAMEKDEKIWGRGALDMKGSCAVMMTLFQNLPHPYPVSLMLTTDEEIGSENGVAYLLREEGWEADFAVIPDGGENFEMVIGEKGVLHLRAMAKGKSAHGSRTWEGENAIDRLLDFYSRLKARFPSEPCGDTHHWHPTLNLGRIAGGKKVNIVPDEATMELDIRFTEPYSLLDMQTEIEGILSQTPGVKMEVLTTGEVVYSPPDHPDIQTFRKVVEKVLGRGTTLSREHGATDGRFFAEKNIPIVIIYPRGSGIHSREEWVSCDSLEQLYSIFENFIRSICVPG